MLTNISLFLIWWFHYKQHEFAFGSWKHRRWLQSACQIPFSDWLFSCILGYLCKAHSTSVWERPSEIADAPQRWEVCLCGSHCPGGKGDEINLFCYLQGNSLAGESIITAAQKLCCCQLAVHSPQAKCIDIVKLNSENKLWFCIFLSSSI